MTVRVLHRFLTISLALSAGPLLAQQAPPAAQSRDSAASGPATPQTATAVGTAYDSLRLRPLAGAVVRLDTSALSATVGEDGRFRLEGIPAGKHYLRVEHPILDTIGVVLRSPEDPYTAGGTLAVELATPSPSRLIELMCAAAWRARGPAALMGRVRHADSGVPATGAKVSLVWYEVEVSGGIKRVPRVREATVGADGTYRICGLPAQLDGKVQVIHGPLTSGDITVSFGHELLYLRSMSIANPALMVAVTDSTDSTAVTTQVLLGSARLAGRVLNAAGRPLAGARVQLEGTVRTATTRPTGEFFLDSLPPGTQLVTVRLLGYAPTEEAVDLSSAETRNVTIRLNDYVPVLETVRVTAQRERALDAVGFMRRKRMGQGYYLDGDQINTNALNFSDVLRTVPGIRVAPMGGNRQVITSSRNPNGCVRIWIDGTQWQQLEPGDVDDFVKPHELAAIEVYNSTSVPAEYQGVGGGGCATIVAWTTRRLDRRR